jgi:hypothetical protein
MGSFYARCSITNITLEDYMPTMIQLLIPNNREFSWKKGLQIYDSVPPFLPFGFPIRGKYADSNEIDEIVVDENTKRLEEFFGAPIGEIIRICSRDSWEREIFKDYKNPITKEERDEKIAKIKNIDLLKKMNASFIHPDVYDFMCEDWESVPSNLSEVGMYDMDGAYFVETLDNIMYRNAIGAEKDVILKEIGKKLIKRHGDKFSKSDLKELSESHFQHNTDKYSYLGRHIRNIDYIFLMQYRIQDFGDEMKKQYKFLTNLAEIGTLIPSMYGGQDRNHTFIRKLNKRLDSILKEHFKNTGYESLDDEEYAEFQIELEIERRDDTINELLKKEMIEKDDVVDIIKKLLGDDFNSDVVNKMLNNVKSYERN